MTRGAFLLEPRIAFPRMQQHRLIIDTFWFVKKCCILGNRNTRDNAGIERLEQESASTRTGEGHSSSVKRKSKVKVKMDNFSNSSLLLYLYLQLFSANHFLWLFGVAFGFAAMIVNGLCVTPMIAPLSSRRNGVLSRSFLPARISHADVRIRVLDFGFFLFWRESHNKRKS
jgi:predicted permease